MDKKTAKLFRLKRSLASKKEIALISSPNDLVFGEGDPYARVVVIGEAAGRQEAIEHKPFVGAAGKFLNKLLESVNLRRDDIYITNVIKARPPNNRPPTLFEIATFQPFLEEEITIIKPKIIIILGRFSLAIFLPDKKISQVHGQVFQKTWNGLDLTIIPMYHPAAALRSSSVKQALEKDFLILKNFV